MTNKERLDNLEFNVGAIQDELQNIRTGMADKMTHLETMLQQLTAMIHNNCQSRSATNHDSIEPPNQTSVHADLVPPAPLLPDPRPAQQPRPNPPRHVKLDFPRFQGGDPTQWISKAKQYFAYQGIPSDQQVDFASYHLEEEANEWWQATSKHLREITVEIKWGDFEEELWCRFGPTEADNFDEALSKIRQAGSLQEYHREFERLQNKVEGWTEKALLGSYMGGLKESIAEGIRLFQPETLKRAISLARMREKQLMKTDQNRVHRTTPMSANSYQSSPSPSTNSTVPREEPMNEPKRLTWDEMKKKRSLGLCFSCDEKFSPGHRCRKPQLLLMEGIEDDESQINSISEDEVGCPAKI